MITWVIGSGGLLGGALARRCPDRYEPGPVPWDDPTEARRTLHWQARDFEAATQGQPWRVIWAAGAATTATPREQAHTELLPLEGLLTGLRSALPNAPGSVFLTSSVGGVYAGSLHPPFTPDTPPAPLSAYGELKLAQEALLTQTLGNLVPCIIGRVSNLYGPGQNLNKLQGLISRLALSAVTRQPINIFVPLDTIRDYIYSDDAAAAILAATDPTRDGSTPTTARPSSTERSGPMRTRTEIIGSGQGTTIAQLVRTMNELAKRRVPVALGTHPSATAQALDLRVTPSIPLPQRTPLPAGIKAVHDDILERTQRADVAAPA